MCIKLLPLILTITLFCPSSSSLHSFLHSLPYPSHLLLHWNQTQPPCTLPGITCTGTDILSVNLSNIGISTSLSSSIPHLCSIPTLTSLDLSFNEFAGPIPSSLHNCSHLHTLVLEGNLLTGPIPPQLFLSGLLTYIDLGHNALTGTIPPEISFSYRLEHVDFYENLLSGEIPKELLLLPNLKYLYLNTNNLTGPMPDFPPGCAIREVYFHENTLSGEIPDSLFG